MEVVSEALRNTQSNWLTPEVALVLSESSRNQWVSKGTHAGRSPVEPTVMPGSTGENTVSGSVNYNTVSG